MIPSLLAAAAAGAGLAPLQAGDLYSSTVEVILQIGEFGGGVLGLFIAYQAYRGYRRNDSRPMLYMAAGFVVIFAVPFVLFAAFLLTPIDSLVAVQGGVQAFEILGLLCIIYALRVEP